MKLSQRLVLHYYKTKLNTISSLSPQKAAKSAFQLFCTPPSSVNRKTEMPPLFHKGEKIFLFLNKIKINGFRFQSLNSNNKLILICHGFQSNCYKFEKYIKLLLKEGFTVVVFDAPAHGNSEGKTINASLYCKMILEIEKVFGPLYGIIAHSLGGLAATLAFEEMDSEEKKLILIAPATETQTAIKHFFTIIPVKSEVQQAFEQYIYNIAGHSSSWYSITRAIQTFKSKTLWLHDEDDEPCPYDDTKTVREMKLPNLNFITTKGLGHNKIYRDTFVQNMVIQFLMK